MKLATQAIWGLVFGIGFSIFADRFLVGSLREGFNWPAILAISGAVLTVTAGFVWRCQLCGPDVELIAKSISFVQQTHRFGEELVLRRVL